MNVTDLEQRTAGLLEQARASSAHRAAETVYGGSDHALRQTMIALAEGAELAEHESPGEATLQVLHGEVELRSGAERTALRAGQLTRIPGDRHSLSAGADAVVLLTVVKAG